MKEDTTFFMYTEIMYGYDEARKKYRGTLYGWSFSLYKRTLSSTSAARRNFTKGIKYDLIPPYPPYPPDPPDPSIPIIPSK